MSCERAAKILFLRQARCLAPLTSRAMDAKSQSIVAFLQSCGEAAPSLAPNYARMEELYTRGLGVQLQLQIGPASEFKFRQYVACLDPTGL